jgi:hypothetical protein
VPWHDGEIVFKNDGSLARIQGILARLAPDDRAILEVPWRVVAVS